MISTLDDNDYYLMVFGGKYHDAMSVMLRGTRAILRGDQVVRLQFSKQ